MKVKKFLILFVATFFFSFLNVEAFSTSLGIKNEAYLNENITVNINLSNLGSTGLATGQYYLNYDSFKVQYIGFNVGQGKPNADYSVSNDGSKVILLYIDNTATDNPLKNGIFATVTFKAIALGQTSFSVSGSGFSTVENGIVDLTTNNSNKSINIINNTTTTTTKKVETTTTKKVETTTKKVEPITTKKTDNNTTTQTTTTKSTNKTTTTTTTEKVKNNSSLKTLTIKGMEFNFNKEIFEYEVTAPFDMEQLELTYELENPNSSIEISDTNLKIGDNEIIIKIFSEDKTEKQYKIKVHKSPKYTKVEFNKIKLIELLNSNTQFIEMDVEISNNNIVLEKEFIDLIKQKNAEIKINITNDEEIIYYVIINNKNISFISNHLDLNIIDTSFNLEDYFNDDYIVLNVKDNETINKNINIYFNAKYFDFKKLYSYILKEKMEFIKHKDYRITSEYIKLNLEENNIYILSNVLVNSNSIVKPLVKTLLLIFTIIVIILLLIMKKKKIRWFKWANI